MEFDCRHIRKRLHLLPWQRVGMGMYCEQKPWNFGFGSVTVTALATSYGISQCSLVVFISESNIIYHDLMSNDYINDNNCLSCACCLYRVMFL